MRTNNRIGGFVGDLRAQVGAAQLGVERLTEIIGRYGPEAVKAAVDFVIEDTRRRFTEEIAAWPDGVYESDMYVDPTRRATATSTCTARSPSTAAI